MCALVAFWLISPMLLFLMVFNKDTIVVFFILVAAVALRSSLPLVARIAIVAVVYVAYASIFRQYYFLIVAIFVAIVVMRRLPSYAVISLCLVGVAVGVVMPSHMLSHLQESRDIFNIDRLGRDMPGVRTAFGNIV